MTKAVKMFLYVIVAMSFFTGCSPEPSADDGQKFIEDWLNLPVFSGGQLKLVTFTKTNGQKGHIQNAQGVLVQSYSLEYIGEIEAVHRCALINPALLPKYDGKVYAVSESDADFNSFTNSILSIGQRFTISGTIVFEKTEKGWKGSRIENQILFDPWFK